jgi:hypothetical protein
MNTRTRRLLLAVCAGAAGFLACAIVGSRASRAMSPCLPFHPVTLTGTLIEVRQGDTVVPSEQAILEGLPRHVCVSGSVPYPDAGVTVTDCDFPEHSVKANLVP